MSSWAGAYGAGAMADSLEKMVAQKFLERKQAEIERAQRVQEQAEQQRMAQQGDQFRQSQVLQLTNLRDDRDARFEDRTRQVQRDSVLDQRHDTDRAGDAAREAERIKAEQKHRTDERLGRQSFEQLMASRVGGASPKDQIELERARLQLEAEKQKQAGAGQERERQTSQSQESTQAAFDSVDRLLDPNGVGSGLDSSYGNWEMRKGRTQASSDFQAERDRFVAMLSLPNLGALKGPMSDKDLLFIKQISSTLSNDNISEKAARDEMTRAKQWLIEKGAAPATGSGGGGQPMTRPIRNKQTGETRMQTSTDGGKTWN